MTSLVRGGFYNQSLETNREHMVRAVFEGVAYNSRWLLKYVEQFNGRPVEAINMVGGGAKSEIWCQIHADVLNRPIRQMKDPIEVNVRGAALLASAALGYLRYDEIGSACAGGKHLHAQTRPSQDCMMNCSRSSWRSMKTTARSTRA